MSKLTSLVTPAAAAAAFLLAASPLFAQQKYHGGPSEQPQNGGAPAVESRQQQPERARPRQQDEPRQESQPQRQPAQPQRQAEQAQPQPEPPRAQPRDQGGRDQGRTSDNRRSDNNGRRSDDNRRRSDDNRRRSDDNRRYEGRAVPRGDVYAPHYEPRYSPRYSPRYYTPRGYGYYGSRSYYRPYVFRPRYSIGFGLYAGFPVPYSYSYADPIFVYGYRAPRERVMITPGSMYYGGIALEMTPYDADVFVDGTYAGRVEDFDGTTQPLTLTTGVHEIEVQAVGYEPMRVNVEIQPGQIIPYRGDLRPY